MCGRFAASASTEDIVETFQVELVVDEPEPTWNAAPTDPVPAVVERLDKESGEAVRKLVTPRWGLVPSWSKDAKGGARMINARAETVLDKPAYARAAAARRCLVPASGWYEWQVSPTATDAKGKPRKQPFFMHRDDAVPVTFAGLFEFWRDPAAQADDPLAWLTTFTIITTAAEPGLSRIHDRQPLVLDPDQWSAWLDPQTAPETVDELLGTHRPGRFAAYPVGRAVGNSRVNGPHLLDPVGPDELVGVVDPSTGEVIG